MVSYTYSSLQDVVNIDPAITSATIEKIIDAAINLLNIYVNATIDNMGGTAGSKSVTLTSKQAGAVAAVATSVYYKNYREQIPARLDILSTQVADMEPPDIIAERLGTALNEVAALSDPPIFLSEDPIPT